jgi:hypothetical protein
VQKTLIEGAGITPIVSEFPHREFKLPLTRPAVLDPYRQWT